MLRGRYFRGQRDCGDRLANVPYDFTGKVVLDMGCNTGGMLHYLADRLKKGIGVDYDFPCINAANLVKNLNNVNNLQFFTVDLSDKDGLKLIDSFILDNHVDIVFLLSVCMWLPNWKEVIAYAAQKADVLLFESNGDERQQKEQEAFLGTCFGEVALLNVKSEDDLGQKNRSLFLCKGALSRANVS
jgi:SAM-dependent methyltransferase